MNPAIARSGKSFKGLVQYLIHDPEHANSNDRVEFTATRNLRTDDPEKAAKVMAWTAMHAQDLKRAAGEKLTGRQMTSPVYHFSLNWNPGEQPSQEEMIAYADENLKALGLEEHEAIFVAHKDHADRKHLHIAVNKVHPVRGVAPKQLSNDRNRLQALAYAYEKEQGKILCTARIAKYEQEPARKLNARKALQARRAAEKTGKTEKKSKARPKWDREQIARQTALDRQAKRDAEEKTHELYRSQELEPAQDIAAERAAFQAQQAEDAALARRQKFEQWATERENALYLEQEDQRGFLGEEWAKRQLQLEALIEEHYGREKRADERQLAFLTKKQGANWVTRIISRFQGDEDEIEALQKNLVNLNQRMRSMVGAFEEKKRQAFDALRTQHSAQRQELEKVIEKRREYSPLKRTVANDDLQRHIDLQNRKHSGRGFS